MENRSRGAHDGGLSLGNFTTTNIRTFISSPENVDNERKEALHGGEDEELRRMSEIGVSGTY